MAKTINEIHSDAEKKLGLRPGATAIIRNPRGILPSQGNISPGGYPVNRPGTGGLMPGMPGSRKMPGMPGMDNENWEIPKSRSMSKGVDVNAASQGLFRSPLMSKPTALNSKLLPHGSGGITSEKSSALLEGSGSPTHQPSIESGMDPLSQMPSGKPTPPQPALVVDRPAPATTIPNVKPEELKRKTASLLEEYFSVRLLDEALQCIVELKSPSYHCEIVREAIILGLEKNPPCVEPVVKLLEYLFAKNVFTAKDISTGCLLYGEMMDDIAIDLPKAPNNFGEILGKLISAEALNFSVVREILQKIEDEIFRKPIFDNTVKVVGQGVLQAPTADVEACKSLL